MVNAFDRRKVLGGLTGSVGAAAAAGLIVPFQRAAAVSGGSLSIAWRGAYATSRGAGYANFQFRDQLVYGENRQTGTLSSIYVSLTSEEEGAVLNCAFAADYESIVGDSSSGGIGITVWGITRGRDPLPDLSAGTFRRDCSGGQAESAALVRMSDISDHLSADDYIDATRRLRLQLEWWEEVENCGPVS